MRNPFHLANLRLFSTSTLWGCNLLCLIWTIHLSMEQARYGWGFGTNLDIGVLYPWIAHFISLPAVCIGAIYLFLSMRKREERLCFCISLLGWLCLVGQIVVSNLFIWM